MRRPLLFRAEQIPLDIEPEPGKVADDLAQSSPHKARDILKKSKPCACSFKHPAHFRPEMSRVFFGLSFASEAEGLTGESSNEAIHSATPRFTIEGSEVRPDRRRIHASLFHRLDQTCGWECFPFDVTNCARLEAEASGSSGGAEVEAADARAY
jgi:hypothetical protein